MNNLNKQHGFTLLELMIVVIIIAILTAIALPAYNAYVVKSRRATASACVVEIAQVMERHRTTTMSYAGAALPTVQCIQDLTGYYVFTLDNQTATTFTAVATPQGAQATRDAECAVLSMTHTGTKAVSGSAGVTECWK